MEHRPKRQMLRIHQAAAPCWAESGGMGGTMPSIPSARQRPAPSRRLNPSLASACSTAPLQRATAASQVLTSLCATRDRWQSAVIKHGILLPFNWLAAILIGERTMSEKEEQQRATAMVVGKSTNLFGILESTKSTLIRAYMVLMLLEITPTAIDAMGRNGRGILYELSSIMSMAITNAGLLFLLELMCNHVTSSGKAREFGIWSFVWRTLAVGIVASVLVAVLGAAFSLNGAIARNSAAFALFSCIPVLLMSVPVIWLIFSNNRRIQLYWFSRLIGRG